MKSVVSRIEYALCWCPREYCSPVTSPSKKLHLLSAFVFVYFSLRKNPLWRSLTSVYFWRNTIYFTSLFNSDVNVHYKRDTEGTAVLYFFLCSIFPLSSPDTSLDKALKKYWLAGRKHHMLREEKSDFLRSLSRHNNVAIDWSWLQEWLALWTAMWIGALRGRVTLAVCYSILFSIQTSHSCKGIES